MIRNRFLSLVRLTFVSMKQDSSPSKQPGGVGDLVAAVTALRRLGAEVVERCPAGDCPLCDGPARIAA